MPDAVVLHNAFISDSLRTLHLFARQLAGSSPHKVVLFIDQFEEVFALIVSEEERQRFFDLLVTTVTEPQGSLLVILTLRADFYDRPMQYSTLYGLLEAHHVSVLSLKREDLRRVIEQPAHLPDVQLTFEGDLVGDLLFEMREQIGALPLLQFTLDQVFVRRRGHQLTLQAYRETGGVSGALSQYVEAVYQDQLKEGQRKLVRDVFLRLIEPGSSELDTTRRRANRSEFILSDPLQTQQVQEILEIFIKARLLTIHQISSNTIIEVSHEALIREWPRLSQWLHEARDDIRLQQIISKDVEGWVQRSRPIDRLYYGSELDDALIWAQRNTPSADEVAFLEASAKKRQKEVENRWEEAEIARAQQARELLLQRRATNRLRWLASMLSVFLVVAIVLSSVAVVNVQEAQRQRIRALEQAQLAQKQARIAVSHTLAAQGDFYLLKNQQDRALLLALNAYRKNDDYDTRNSLLTALLYSPHIESILRAPSFVGVNGYGVSGLAFGDDNKTLFTADSSDNGQLIAWDLGSKNHHFLTSPPFYFGGVSFLSGSSNSHVLATVGPNAFWLWNMTTEKALAPLQVPTSIDGLLSLAFSLDGKILVASACQTKDCTQEAILFFDVVSKQVIGNPLIVPGDIWSMAFNVDGTRLAVATCVHYLPVSGYVYPLRPCSQSQILQWDVATHALVHSSYTGLPGTIQSMAFSPDGKHLAGGEVSPG